MSVKRVLFIPDCHIPFHCKDSYQIMLDCGHDFDPDMVVILGDYADMYRIMSHPKDPGIGVSLKNEVEEINEKLSELNLTFPGAEKVFIEGNHEWRMARYIQNKAPELYGFLKIPELFNLKKHKFKFIPYGPNQYYQIYNTNLYARHEPITGSQHCSHGTIMKCAKSVIFGHTHRVQTATHTGLDGEKFIGISSGWLGDQHKYQEIFSYVKGHHQWTKAFTTATILPNGEWFHNVNYIKSGKCSFNDYVYGG